jgi:hypothetical protein
LYVTCCPPLYAVVELQGATPTQVPLAGVVVLGGLRTTHQN